MTHSRPVIGITMGDPVGIGPEIILLALNNEMIYKICRPLVLGDVKVLETAKKCTASSLSLNCVEDPEEGAYRCGEIDVICCSDLDPKTVAWGKPTALTGKALVKYITTATEMAISNKSAAVVTCPINKTALKMAGSEFHGHTEMIAKQTNTENYAMMLAGKRLRVVLVTIHTPLRMIPLSISTENICKTIEITAHALRDRFGIEHSRIAVAGLNPHAGEEGMFGDEEEKIIVPAIDIAKANGISVKGPFPPDTVFYHAVNGAFDAVVCMYHDQGLIPFKLVHFSDGVNTTLGLPIIRTSVDHGTAYDIAGTGKADPGSLIAAIKMAVKQSKISG